ncbi:MAG: DegV family protein [Christensenellales bacterium]|jgi:DegV family protein with EDD domain
MGYRLMADAACDLPAAYTKEKGILVLPIPVTFNGVEYAAGNDPDAPGYLDPHAFYTAQKNGATSSTAQINPGLIEEAMRTILEAGDDVLYMTLAAPLSGTYANARFAAQNLSKKFPDRQIAVVDSKCVSLGFGMLVWLTQREKENGATFEEIVSFAEAARSRVRHWFTVADLQYLKKSGRISATSAVIGTVLNVKPVLYVDPDGRLVLREKVTGRKKALSTLIVHMEEDRADTRNCPVFISHCDAGDDVDLLAGQVEKKFGVKPSIINLVTPIIGTHVGFGTIALFYCTGTDGK